MLHELYKKPEASFEASDHYHTNTNSLWVYNLAAQINRPATRNCRRASKNLDSAFAFIIECDQVLYFYFSTHYVFGKNIAEVEENRVH